jgi:hypothetical protein
MPKTMLLQTVTRHIASSPYPASVLNVCETEAFLPNDTDIARVKDICAKLVRTKKTQDEQDLGKSAVTRVTQPRTPRMYPAKYVFNLSFFTLSFTCLAQIQ